MLNLGIAVFGAGLAVLAARGVDFSKLSAGEYAVGIAILSVTLALLFTYTQVERARKLLDFPFTLSLYDGTRDLSNVKAWRALLSVLELTLERNESKLFAVQKWSERSQYLFAVLLALDIVFVLMVLVWKP